MENLPNQHRRSIRLKDYDYSSAGAYFMTVCSHKRETIFEDERNRQVVEKYWFNLPRHYPHVELDEFVIMPNHIHGIIVLVGAGYDVRDTFVSRTDKPARPQSGADAGWKSARSQRRRAGLPVLRTAEPAPTNTNQIVKRHSLAEVIRFFKTYTAREINRLRRTPGLPVWQRNYYEHIIRSEQTLNKIREYIDANPLQWEFDLENSLIEPDSDRKSKGQAVENDFWQELKGSP